MTSATTRGLPPGVEIRVAGFLDVPRLVRYFDGLPDDDRWLRFAGTYQPNPHDLEERLGLILIAEDVERHEIVGELSYSWEGWPLGCEELAISVAPGYRTTGVASELFLAWRLRARSRFVRFVVAEQVWRQNRAAEAWLRRTGFTPLPSDPDGRFGRFGLDLGALVIGRLEAMAAAGAGLQTEGPLCDGFAFQLGGSDGFGSPDQLPRETSLGALVACVDDEDALGGALAESGWHDVAGRLLITSPDPAAIELAQVNGFGAGVDGLVLIEDDRTLDLDEVFDSRAVLGVITDRPSVVNHIRDLHTTK